MLSLFVSDHFNVRGSLLLHLSHFPKHLFKSILFLVRFENGELYEFDSGSVISQLGNIMHKLLLVLDALVNQW